MAAVEGGTSPEVKSGKIVFFTGYSESSSVGLEKFKWPPTIGVKIRSEPKPTTVASVSVEIPDVS